ncbi:MAG: hypothetical protein ACLFV4_11575 [Candidatus Hydrogenedentota bacterium]
MNKGLLAALTVFGVVFVAFTLYAIVNDQAEGAGDSSDVEVYYEHPQFEMAVVQDPAEGVEGFSDIEVYYDHPQFEMAVAQDPARYKREVTEERIFTESADNSECTYVRPDRQLKVIVGAVHYERGWVDRYDPEKVLEMLEFFFFQDMDREFREDSGISITRSTWDHNKVEEVLDLLDEMEREGFNVQAVRRFLLENRP